MPISSPAENVTVAAAKKEGILLSGYDYIHYKPEIYSTVAADRRPVYSIVVVD